MTRRKTRSLQFYEVVSGFPSSEESTDNPIHSSFATEGSSQREIFSSQSSIHNTEPLPDEVNDTSVGNGLGCRRESGNPISSSKSSLYVSATKNACQSVENCTRIDKKDLESSGDVDISGRTHCVATSKNASSQTYPTQQHTFSSNRQSAPFVAQQGKNNGNPSPAIKAGDSIKRSSVATAPLPLKRTSSLIRLSLSLDGKAHVTTHKDGSLSPPQKRSETGPKPQGRSNGGLQRSQSAFEQRSLDSTFPKRPMTGRSRDARTWEFYCDNDASNALTEQAEREQSGSAVGPISLIRSRGYRNISTILTRCNAGTPKLEPAKRARSDAQMKSKPKLARASSSAARLQIIDGNVQKREEITNGKLKPKPRPVLYELPDGDSDKENWEPGTQSRRVRRRQITNSQPSGIRQRAILGESSQAPSQPPTPDILENQENVRPGAPSPKGAENHDPTQTSSEVRNEVAALMEGSNIPREIEDLEGVQNLLSLSKAVWL